MIHVILDALTRCGIENYFVTERKTTSAELFFVKKELNQIRSAEVTDYSVSVYRDVEREGKALTGSATCSIEVGMGADEVAKRLEKAYASCVHSANPAFHFQPGVKSSVPAPENRLSKQSLEASALELAEALYLNDTRGDPLINSSEIFVYRKERHILGSNGCDVSYVRYDADGEFVVQCKHKTDVEMHHTFAYDDLDTQGLSDKVKEALEVVVSRSVAEKAAPRGNCDVILSDKSVETIMEYYSDRASSHMIYPKYSDFAVGMDVMGETTGDRVTMELVAKEPFSAEGIPMIDRPLLESGVVKTIQGHTRLSSYLHVEPTGQYRAARVQCGDMPFSEMIKGRVLHLVSFSDFQMDALSGYFGGEIRLGFLYENGTVTPVTGGSVSGNLIELQKDMRLSKEAQQGDTFTGPKHVLFRNVPVNGD